MPTQSFYRLPDEKQKQLLSASIAEFSKKSFSDASTDIIAKNSGVSKGSLFNYFENKAGLYLYALEKCTEFILETSKKRTKYSEDSFQIMLEAFATRLGLATAHPEITDFVSKASHEQSIEILSQKDEIMGAYSLRSSNESRRVIKQILSSLKLRHDEAIAENALLLLWDSVSLYLIDQAKLTSAGKNVDYAKLKKTIRLYFDIVLHGVAYYE